MFVGQTKHICGTQGSHTSLLRQNHSASFSIPKWAAPSCITNLKNWSCDPCLSENAQCLRFRARVISLLVIFQLHLFHPFIFFLFTIEQNLTVFMDHIVIICPSVSGHLGCFYFLGVASEAAMSTHTQGSLWLEKESLGHMPRDGIARLFLAPFLTS